jgi:hypothetical protein
MLSNLNELFARIANAGMSDEEAERLIEEGAAMAANEVRQHARIIRTNELDLVAYRRERDQEQATNAKNNHIRLQREKVRASEVQAKLKAAEDANGPRRRGSSW